MRSKSLKYFWPGLPGIILLLFSMLSYAQLAKLDSSAPLIIESIKMPSLPPVSRTAAVYFVVKNPTDTDILIEGVETDVAHHAMIHRTQEIDGVAKMQHIDRLVIPAKGQIEFKRGDYHIMLMGIDRDLLSEPFEIKLKLKQFNPIVMSVNPKTN